MKIFCLALLATFTFNCTAFSQKGWFGGIKGGISIPKLRAPSDANASYSNGFSTIIGPQLGVLAEYRFSPLFSLQTEFNYSSQGGEKKGDQRIVTKDFKAYIPAGVSLPDYLYSRFDNRITLRYLELPIMAKFSFKMSPDYRVSIFGGPYIGYLIKAEGEATGESKIYKDPAQSQELTYNGFALGVVDFNRKEDIINQLQKTNYGIQGSSSIEYVAKKLNYFLTIGGTYGLKRLQKDPNFGNNKTGGLNLNLGVTHKL